VKSEKKKKKKKKKRREKEKSGGKGEVLKGQSTSSTSLPTYNIQHVTINTFIYRDFYRAFPESTLQLAEKKETKLV